MIYFWKVFHMYYKLICILYALLCGQNFILVKSGCYTQPQAPPPPPRDRLGDFQRTKLPTFSYSVEPMDADD
jgi:hypothetical protein